MDLLGPIISVLNLLWTPLKKRFYYLRDIDKNVETLLCSMEELHSRENDIKEEMSTTVSKGGKKPRSELLVWLKNVEIATNEMNKIQADLTNKRRCMNGCLPNCCSRYKIGKDVIERIKKVAELQNKSVFPNGLFLDPLPGRGKTIPTTTLLAGKTSGKVQQMVWECLMDPHIRKIGVYGMGGVGKTTIMMHFNNRLNEAHVFDSVIWVTLSKALNLEKLQNDIAKAMGLDLAEDEDTTNRAAKLYEDLQRRKKFVLILDDLWCKFPLEKVGIPQPNGENGCKLIFTTRLMEVCRGMETQRDIKVEVLSKEEAWDLFIDKVGVEALSPEIEMTAKVIPEECGRLPLAIITVGRAMRNIDDIRIWRNALEELRSSRAEIEGMEDEVFARLEFSYNRLRNDKVRACFLYCALYPEDYKIDIEELVEYWMAEGLINEVGDREKEIDKGHALLNEVKDACMVESVGTKWVKMHDLLRDLAIRITKENPLFIVKAGMELKKWPTSKEWVVVERVSLMENKIEMPLDHPNCPKLSTLLLQRNPLLQIIPTSFFEHMQNLRVLDLSDTGIRSLPDSLSNLYNLHALLLRFCMLKKLPSLAKLKELRTLDLSYTYIKELATDIEGLLNLRRLDLSYTEKLKRFPTRVITKLSHLENLSMFKSRWKWSSTSLKMGDEEGFEEIMNSSQLSNLGLSFKDLPSFMSYVRSMHWQGLRSYHLDIGLLSNFLPISKGNRCVEIQGCNLELENNHIELPYNSLQLALQGCHDITRLSKISFMSKLSELKECYVSRCNGMEYITMGDENTLTSLEKLVLRKLPKLRTLCNGIITSSMFARLKALHVHGCNNLKNLLPFGLLKQLHNLEEIEVWNSSLIEEIIGEDMNKTNNDTTCTISLPKLHRLYFSSLPQLRSISKRSFICDSLDDVNVWDCWRLKKLPLSMDNLPFTLKHIRGSRKWWDALEWENPNTKTFYEPSFKEEKVEEEEQKRELTEEEQNRF